MNVPRKYWVSDMTKALDMKDVDWLKLYVDSEVDKFSKKFDVEIDQQEIEDICKIVVSLKLPEGVDAFYAMMLLTKIKTEMYCECMLNVCRKEELTLGLDMLIYMYGWFSETDHYNEQVAFIFKNCIQYTIPF